MSGKYNSKQNYPTSVLLQMALETVNKYGEHSHIYTDASKTPNKISIGMFDDVAKRSLSTNLSNETCIMTAELTAIYIACEYVIQHEYINPVIFTDSLASCMYLMKQISDGEFDELTYKICCNASNITIQWIPSHIGLRGNEMADNLARNVQQTTETFDNKILLADACNNFKEAETSQFYDWYKTESINKGRKYYAIQNEITKKPWFYKLKIKSRDLRCINRLMAGHDFSPYWLAVMNITDSGLCDVCGVDNTSEHIILHCVKFYDQQNKYNFSMYTTLSSLFKDFNLKNLEDVCSYLKEINMEL